MPECFFLDIEDSRWTETLAACSHDLYHLPAYARLEAQWIDAEPSAFVYQDRDHSLLIPLLIRATPGGEFRDAVTPYGYSPPVASFGASAEFIEEALAAFDKQAAAQGLISTFMRLHPLLVPELHLSDSLSSWCLVQRGQTVAMPLSDARPDWERSLVKGHRYDLRHLSKSGCSVVMDSEEAWDAFPAIYRDTMERIGAGSAYFYSDDYLRRFRETLGANAICCMVRDAVGKIMCAAIFTRVGDMVQYHLSGTVAAFARQAPNKMMLAGVREWCRDQGIGHFHLGGGFGGGSDSLFKFKRRFGGDPLPFRTVSAVHDAEAFAHECQLWQAESEKELAGLEGFFPPYRAPQQ